MISASEIGVREQVDGVEHQQRIAESQELRDAFILHIEVLGHRSPRVVMLDMVVVLMVLPVRNTPAVEGDQQRSVADVTENVAQKHTVSESTVA